MEKSEEALDFLSYQNLKKNKKWSDSLNGYPLFIDAKIHFHILISYI